MFRVVFVCAAMISMLAAAQEPPPAFDAMEEETAQAPRQSSEGPIGDVPYRPDVLEGAGAMEMVESLEQFEDLSLDEDELPPKDGLRLTVRRAVEMALENNPQVYVTYEDYRAAVARIKQAKAQALPQATAQLSQIYNDRIDDDDFTSGISGFGGLGGGFGGGLGGAGGLGGGIGAKQGVGGGLAGLNALSGLGSLASFALQDSFLDDFVPDRDPRLFRLQIDQVLYTGGRIRAAIRAAEHLAHSQEWQRTVTLDDLEFQTKQAYYDALLAQALLRVADESVKTFERQLKDAQDMYEVGMVSSFDVLRAKTELEQRRAERIAARNSLRLAYTNLRRLISVPQDTPLMLEAKLDWFPYMPPLNKLVADAYEMRPEIEALERSIDAGHADLDRVKGSYKPSLALSGEYVADEGIPTQSDGWLFSLTADWEIAAGGRRRGERLETKANIESLKWQLEDLKDLVEQQVTQSRIQIQDAIAQTQSERSTVEFAREGLRLAELRFQEGVGTTGDTLDAELALTRAESALVQALRDFAVASAALERAVGESWVREKGEPTPLPEDSVAAERRNSMTPRDIVKN